MPDQYSCPATTLTQRNQTGLGSTGQDSSTSLQRHRPTSFYFSFFPSLPVPRPHPPSAICHPPLTSNSPSYHPNWSAAAARNQCHPRLHSTTQALPCHISPRALLPSHWPGRSCINSAHIPRQPGPTTTTASPVHIAPAINLRPNPKSGSPPSMQS